MENDIRISKCYEIDFDKINTIDDMKEVMKGLDIRINDNYPTYEGLKHLLKEVK